MRDAFKIRLNYFKTIRLELFELQTTF